MAKKTAEKKTTEQVSKQTVNELKPMGLDLPPADLEEIFEYDYDGTLISHQTINHNQAQAESNDFPQPEY